MKKFTSGEKAFLAVFSILYIGLYWLCYVLNFGWGSGSSNILLISLRGMLPALTILVMPLFFAHRLAFVIFESIFGANSAFSAAIVVFLFIVLILCSVTMGLILIFLFKKIYSYLLVKENP